MFDKISAPTLQHLQSIQGRLLQGIIHHFWTNHSTPGHTLSFLEWVELQMDNGQSYYVYHKEEAGLLVEQWDAELKKTELLQEFGGKITLLPQNGLHHPAWKDLQGKAVSHLHVSLHPALPGNISTVSIEFGNEAVALSAAAEGLALKRVTAD